MFWLLNLEYLEENPDIILTLDILKKNISSYYLEGQKQMKTCETQISKPRVKLTLFDISVWPLKNYDLSYESNKPDIVQAYKTGKIRALKRVKPK